MIIVIKGEIKRKKKEEKKKRKLGEDRKNIFGFNHLVGTSHSYP